MVPLLFLEEEQEVPLLFLFCSVALFGQWGLRVRGSLMALMWAGCFRGAQEGQLAGLHCGQAGVKALGQES